MICRGADVREGVRLLGRMRRLVREFHDGLNFGRFDREK